MDKDVDFSGMAWAANQQGGPAKNCWVHAGNLRFCQGSLETSMEDPGLFPSHSQLFQIFSKHGRSWNIFPVSFNEAPNEYENQGCGQKQFESSDRVVTLAEKPHQKYRFHRGQKGLGAQL